MTISTEDRIAGPFLGNDITTLFPFEFKVFAKADVRVIKTDALGVEIETGAGLTLDLDYSITLNADQNNDPGGDIVYPLGGSAFPTLPTGEKLTVTSDIPELQGNNLPSGGPWNPVIVENALDKTTMLIQQLSQQVDRMLRGTLSDPAIGTLPSAAARALLFLAFDASGDPIASGGGLTSPPVSVFMTTVLDDTTAGAVLTTLGFSAYIQTLIDDTTAAAARTTLGIPTEIQNGSAIYALDTGTADAVLLAMAPAVTVYAEGQKFRSHKLVTNTTAVTVDIDGVGPVPLNQPDGSAILVGQLAAGQPFEFVRHTSAQFRVTSAFPLSFSNPIQSVLVDPTITRDSADSVTLGSFQASPLGAVSPLVSSAGLTRQVTGLFEVAATGNGISENTGALALAAAFTASDLTFTTGPDNIAAGAGTPFSGAVAGDKVVFAGSASNDGVFDISAVNAGGADIDVGQTIAAEAAGASVTVYIIPQSSVLHLHAVRKDADGTIAVAADDNRVGTNIGSGASTGWTQVRRLWSFVLDPSTDIRDGIKLGDHWTYATIAADLVSASTAALLTATIVPTGFSILWHGGVGINVAAVPANSRSEVQLSSGLISAAHPATRPTTPGHHCIGSVTSFAADGGSSVSNIQTDTSGRIRSKMTNTAGAGAVYSFYTDGYTDQRID